MKIYAGIAGATAIAITAGAVGLQALRGDDALSVPFAADDTHGLFLVVTDTHFNPYSDPALVADLRTGDPAGTGSDGWASIFANGVQSNPPWGQDANYTLTYSALQTASQLGASFDYVLYTGDYLDHWFETQFPDPHNTQALAEFSAQTTAYVNDQLDGLTSGPVLSVIGNTDNACHDYISVPDGPYLNDISAHWQNLAGATDDDFKSFALLGSYVVEHPIVPNHDIIVLNNIFWSSRFQREAPSHSYCFPKEVDPAELTLSWLTLQLDHAENNNRTAQILLHMPPGVSGFDTARSPYNCHDRICEYQAARHDGASYNDRFLQALQEHDGVVTQTFSGHSHMDSFVVINDSAGDPATVSFVTPAVSPIFENNPSFAVYQYDKTTGAVTDKAVFYVSNYGAIQGQNPAVDSPVWALGYSFRNAYGVSDMSPATMAGLGAAIQAGGAQQATYDLNYTARSTEPSIRPGVPAYRAAFTCSLTNASAAEFAACYHPSEDGQ